MRLIPCIYGLVVNTTEDFCVVEQLVSRVTNSSDIGLEVPASVGASALILQDKNYMAL